MNTNAIYQKMSRKAEQWAGDFAGCGWVKAMIPENINDEIKDTVLHNYKINSLKEKFTERFASSLEDESTKATKRVKAKDIIDKANYENVEETLNSLEELLGPLEKEGTRRRFIRNAKGDYERATFEDAKAKLLESKNPFNYYGNMAAAYFQHPDSSIRNTRIGTAIGGYTALAVGGRFLSGGNLTHDSYGNKDIAGIPII